MIQTSWANHYKLGYNNEWFTFRDHPTDRFDISFDGCGRAPRGMAFEANNAASIISEKYGKDNIALLYSGGCDSEIILLSFIGSGRIPGRIIFLNYGTNEYDLRNARRFCRYYGLPLEVIDVPAIEMLNSGEALEVCKKFQCGQVGLSFYLKAIDDLCKSHYVVTGDEPYFELMNNPLTGEREWFFFAREPFYSLWKVFIKNNVDGCPNFIQYTPDLWLSYIDDPIMCWLRNDQTDLINSNQVKYDIYRHRFYTRPRVKATGMELFVEKVINSNQRLLEDCPELTMQELKYPFKKMYYEMTRFIKDEYSPT